MSQDLPQGLLVCEVDTNYRVPTDNSLQVLGASEVAQYTKIDAPKGAGQTLVYWDNIYTISVKELNEEKLTFEVSGTRFAELNRPKVLEVNIVRPKLSTFLFYLAPGSKQEFFTKVKTSNLKSKGVKWSISSPDCQLQPDTTIDQSTGLLTISKQEPENTHILVKAISIDDPSKENTSEVTVRSTLNPTYSVSYFSDSDTETSTLIEMYPQGKTIPLQQALYSRNGISQTGWTLQPGGKQDYSTDEKITVLDVLKLYPAWNEAQPPAKPKLESEEQSGDANKDISTPTEEKNEILSPDKRELLAKAEAKRVAESFKILPSTYEKVCAVRDYLVNHVEYHGTNAYYIHEGYGALLQKHAACSGYAYAAKYILDELGIENVVQTGRLTATNVAPDITLDHSWNVVKIDHKWYHLDITFEENYPYQYFLLDDLRIENTRTIGKREYDVANSGRFVAKIKSEQEGFHYVGDQDAATAMESAKKIIQAEAAKQKQAKTFSVDIAVPTSISQTELKEYLQTVVAKNQVVLQDDSQIENFHDWARYILRVYDTAHLSSPSQDNATWRVEYYQQNITDDGYTKLDGDTVTKEGPVGALVVGEEKDYIGFYENTTHQDRIVSGTVEADGSLTLKRFYDRAVFTLSFDGNGYTGGTLPESVTKRYGDTLKITAPSITKEGYVFDYWKGGNYRSGEIYTFRDNLTLVAQWKANANSSERKETEPNSKPNIPTAPTQGKSGTPSVSTSSTPTAPSVPSAPTSSAPATPTVPSAPATPSNSSAHSITAEKKVPTNSTTEAKQETATIKITKKQLADGVQKSLDTAKSNGTEQNEIRVEIKAKAKSNQQISFQLLREALDKAVKSQVRELKLNSGYVVVVPNQTALKEIQKTAQGDVNISVTPVDNTTLSKEATKVINKRPVYDLSIVDSKANNIHKFGKGSVSVSIPYTLGKGEKASNVFAYYVDAAGNAQEIANSVYNKEKRQLSFTTDHFSVYGVGYKAEKESITDIGIHWAKESIEFVTARGLMKGTEKGKFDPEKALTRGMLVTALGKLAGADVSQYKTSQFTDVAKDAYYLPYVEWASKNGIMKGTTNTTFAPEENVTREQMAVIMAAYAKAIGFEVPKTRVENKFADSDKISDFAKDAVKQLQMAGILSGKSGNLFEPQGIATRAQTAAVLKRFVELEISSDNAPGWTQNDSGKWMYYKDGKALTLKQTIAGVEYQFNASGETDAAPKSLAYGSYIIQKGDSFWKIARDHQCSMAELAIINGKTIYSMIHPSEVLQIPQEK